MDFQGNNTFKRLEDKYRINFREKGFPEELLDSEPEEKGQEV